MPRVAPTRPSLAAQEARRAREAAAAHTVVFYATHELPQTDAVLIQRYAREVSSVPSCSMWVLLYSQEHAGDMQSDAAASATLAGTPVARWGDDSVRRKLGKLWASASSLRTHTDKVHGEAFYRRFSYFHASLLLWWRGFGALHPQTRWMWRLEPDVLFSGGLDAMLRLASRDSADVLLPAFRSQGEYPFWRYNAHVIEALPATPRTYSLVSVGRYSRRFVLDIMARHWEAGLAGFEEILLPMACLHAGLRRGQPTLRSLFSRASPSPPACTLGSFNASSSVGAAHFTYRPAWRCAEFVAARRKRTNEIWHPVKSRDCMAAFLLATQGNRSAELAYRSRGCSYPWCKPKN